MIKFDFPSLFYVTSTLPMFTIDLFYTTIQIMKYNLIAKNTAY